MLRKSKKKFAVVTSAEHFKHYEPLMPEGTRYLVEDNPDIRRFLQDGIPLGTDVAVVDEAGFCAQGDSQNRADLVAFLQDLADAGASMQIVVVASEKREKGDPWIAELYSRGIYDVIDPMRSYDLDATIERAVRHPAAAEDVEGGYRADEPGGMAAILAARKAKKERKRAAKAARGGVAEEDRPKSISEQMGASSGESEGPRPLLDGPSETQLARERLHDSGKLPRIAEAEAGVYEVVDEEPAPAAEPRPGGRAPQEAPLPEPEAPQGQDGPAGEGPEGAGAMMAPGQAALLELVREEVAREQEQREERMRREYEQREERMRREYEQRIGEAMRSGRRQRVVAVAGAAPSAMTAEPAPRTPRRRARDAARRCSSTSGTGSPRSRPPAPRPPGRARPTRTSPCTTWAATSPPSPRSARTSPSSSSTRPPGPPRARPRRSPRPAWRFAGTRTPACRHAGRSRRR